MEKEQRGIVKWAALTGLGTLLSRIVGLGREVLMASLFGTGMFADAFSAAFRIPNILRRLFGEGGLKVVLIPLYDQQRMEFDDDEAFIFASSVAVILTIFVAIIIVLGVIFAPYIAHIAHGWKDQPEKFALTIRLLRVLFPFIGLITLATWASGILNAHKKFFLPAFAPTFLNIGWLAGAALALWFFGDNCNNQVMIVCYGVLIGGLMQFLIQIPALKRIGFKFTPAIKAKTKDLLEMGKLLTPALAALCVAEINFIVDLFLASSLVEGSVSALTYASRLIFLPMGLASVAIATASLPALSEMRNRMNMEKFRTTLQFSFRTTLGIMLPVTAFIIATSPQIVRLVLEWGSFSGDVSTPLVAFALSMYAVGLYAFSSFKILTHGFYAMKDTLTPVINSAIALIINIELNLIFIGIIQKSSKNCFSGLAGKYLLYLSGGISNFMNT